MPKRTGEPERGDRKSEFHPGGEPRIATHPFGRLGGEPRGVIVRRIQSSVGSFTEHSDQGLSRSGQGVANKPQWRPVTHGIQPGQIALDIREVRPAEVGMSGALNKLLQRSQPGRGDDLFPGRGGAGQKAYEHER